MPAPQEFHDSILYLTSVENAVSLPSFPVSDWECFPGGSTSHFNDISKGG
ncbi:MAG: hypothetical protein LW814_15210 [Anabaena sp. CoA2_C59]|nr:hypothetical protein [Anabaena sp. CoA2_C59]